MRPARTEIRHLFANYRNLSRPADRRSRPDTGLGSWGWRPVACRKSPAAQTPRSRDRVWPVPGPRGLPRGARHERHAAALRQGLCEPRGQATRSDPLTHARGGSGAPEALHDQPRWVLHACANGRSGHSPSHRLSRRVGEHVPMPRGAAAGPDGQLRALNDETDRIFTSLCDAFEVSGRTAQEASQRSSLGRELTVDGLAR